MTHRLTKPGSLKADQPSEIENTLAQRREHYGHPADNFRRAAGMLNALLEPKLAKPLDEHDVGAMYIALKLARLPQDRTHADTIHDIQGYARCMEMVIERLGDGK